MIYMLLIFDDGDAFHGRVNPLSLLVKIQIVSGELPAKRKGMNLYITGLLLCYIGVVYQRSIVTIILYFVIVDHGIFFSKDLGYSIGQNRMRSQTLMTLNDLHLSIFFCYDQRARL